MLREIKRLSEGLAPKPKIGLASIGPGMCVGKRCAFHARHWPVGTGLGLLLCARAVARRVALLLSLLICEFELEQKKILDGCRCRPGCRCASGTYRNRRTRGDPLSLCRRHVVDGLKPSRSGGWPDRCRATRPRSAPGSRGRRCRTRARVNWRGNSGLGPAIRDLMIHVTSATRRDAKFTTTMRPRGSAPTPQGRATGSPSVGMPTVLEQPHPSAAKRNPSRTSKTNSSGCSQGREVPALVELVVVNEVGVAFSAQLLGAWKFSPRKTLTATGMVNRGR